MSDAGQSRMISSLLYSIHATTGDDDAWSGLLEQLREWLDSQWTTLASHHFLTGRGQILHQAPEDPDMRASYAEHAARNPWFLSSEEYRPGMVLSGENFLSNHDLIRTDFYRSLLQPRRLLHRLCGVAARRGDMIYFVSLLREQGKPRFSPVDSANLKSVLSHLTLAIENRWREEQARGFGQAMVEIIEQTSIATFLVDRDGTILFRNHTAENLLRNESGLRVDHDRLVAAIPTDAHVMRDAIRDVACSEGAGARQQARVLCISVPGSHHPTVLTVSRAGRTFFATKGETQDLVVITARNQNTRHDHCSFARQFEFTPAQARLSALLFTGHSLFSAARILHVSENTVRSHLKQIFQKTNTHSQMELVHLHSRICIDME